MDFLFGLIFIIILLQEVRAEEEDCTQIKPDRPTFSRTMPEALWTMDGSSFNLYCCLYGVDEIIWTFRNRNSNNLITIEKSKMYAFDYNKTKLEIINTKAFYNTGYFGCLGIKNGTKTLLRETFLKIVLQESELNFQLTQFSNRNSNLLKPLSSHTIFCVLIAFLAYKPQFRWIHETRKNISIIKNGSLNETVLKDPLIEGYTGMSDLTIRKMDNENNVYNFSLSLYSMNFSHEGSYKCEIMDGKRMAQAVLHIYIHKIDKIPIFGLLGTIGSFLFLIMLLYIFQYDIKIYIKSILRILLLRKYLCKKYNFFFIYNFDDDEEVKEIYTIVEYMKLQGFTSYFHNRDQKYGKDILENLSESIGQSDVIVIWASSELFKHNLYDFCVQMLIKNFSNTKRIYVMREKKRRIMAYCKSKTIIADLNSCLTTKTFFKYRSSEMDNSKTNILIKWNNHKLLRWFISSLPIKTMKKKILY